MIGRHRQRRRAPVLGAPGLGAVGLGAVGLGVVGLGAVGLVVVLAAALLALGGIPPAAGPDAPTGSVSVRSAAPSRPSTDPGPVLPALTGGRPPSGAGLVRRLGPVLADHRLGTAVGMSVVDVTTGDTLYSASTGARVPASTAKLATAAAALTVLGAGHRFRTTAVAGAGPGDVVLVGGGDPTLSVSVAGSYRGAAELTDLAAQVRRRLGHRPRRVLVDATLFTGADRAPGWDPDVRVNGDAAPITALMVDGGRTAPRYDRNRSRAPDLAAGTKFAQLLGLPASAVVRGRAAHGARLLGHVSSAPLASLVERMLGTSDNVVAEALGRQVALARHEPASFAGAATAIRTVLRGLGLPVRSLRMTDASGLSRADRLDPALLTAILRLAASRSRPELSSVYTGLPVAGYSGTLADRYRHGSARRAAGVLRAKTGALTGVQGLAGLVVDVDHRLLAFAVLANGGPDGAAATTAIDAVAATLAGCGCR
ncbi:D-alanyl-D-alanine carboxypeptidase/D-alanyl-D-alanine endopeptidase [Actinocatenispora sera]|uniref:D-alanyl-D-alanine carboxypeptidase/D-alanyl-D-alanine endopeptidase n=1 Tax=Actinocatenispora sera TaxID=390989 RepID=UPI0006925DA5|nr:D-alanyl-D-alanine carboxypeptidase/D-alanyl-D-alanine-endopeptidase [Actinocatenispora sera]